MNTMQAIEKRRSIRKFTVFCYIFGIFDGDYRVRAA